MRQSNQHTRQRSIALSHHKTYRQGTHRSDVSTLAALRLDDKHPIPTRTRTLLDGIACIDERVQTRVAPQTELGHRHVVRDRRGKVHHRDVERGVVLASSLEDQQRIEGFKSTDEHQPVNIVLLEAGGDGTEIDVGQCAVRPEFGSTPRHPSVYTEPRKLVDCIIKKAPETIVHREGCVTLFDAVPHCGAGRGIHTTCRRTNTRGGEGLMDIHKVP